MVDTEQFRRERRKRNRKFAIENLNEIVNERIRWLKGISNVLASPLGDNEFTVYSIALILEEVVIKEDVDKRYGSNYDYYAVPSSQFDAAVLQTLDSGLDEISRDIKYDVNIRERLLKQIQIYIDELENSKISPPPSLSD